jgi:hypothetical protein
LVGGTEEGDEVSQPLGVSCVLAYDDVLLSTDPSGPVYAPMTSTRPAPVNILSLRISVTKVRSVPVERSVTKVHIDSSGPEKKLSHRDGWDGLPCPWQHPSLSAAQSRQLELRPQHPLRRAPPQLPLSLQQAQRWSQQVPPAASAVILLRQ